MSFERLLIDFADGKTGDQRDAAVARALLFIRYWWMWFFGLLPVRMRGEFFYSPEKLIDFLEANVGRFRAVERGWGHTLVLRLPWFEARRLRPVIHELKPVGVAVRYGFPLAPWERGWKWTHA